MNLLVLERGRLNGVRRIKCVGWGGEASEIERERFRNARLGIESNLRGEGREGRGENGRRGRGASEWEEVEI